MAFDASQDQESQNQQANQANQQAGQAAQPLSGGGGGFAGQGGAPGAGAPGSYSQQPTHSGSWTNLDSYLSANSDQAPQLGQQIASTVGGQAQQAQSDLNTLQQGFQNQAPYSAINSTTNQTVDNAFSDPSQYASGSGANYTQAENYLNNNWGLDSASKDIQQYAPTSGPTWSSVGSEYNTANQNLQDTQSESGRDLLLQNQFGGNGSAYNQGEQNFDQLLLQQSPQNQTAFQGVYNQYSPGVVVSPTSTNGQSADLTNALTSSQNYVTGEQAKATGFANQAGQDLSNSISNLNSGIGGEVTADNATNAAAYQAMANALQGNTATKEQLAGLNKVGAPQIQQGEGIYNIQLQNYLAQGPSYTNSTAATGQDLSNYQGLQALLSGYQPPSGSTAPGAATDQQALGSIFGASGVPTAQAAPINPYSFNGTQFTADQQAAGTNYNSALQDAVNSGASQSALQALINQYDPYRQLAITPAGQGATGQTGGQRRPGA